jgi:hypothetical protein
MSSKPPSFLLPDPDPQTKQRLYNGRKLLVWEGRVKVASIQGWVDNPRINLAKRTLQEKVGSRELSQKEVFDLMKNDPEVRLKGLRDDILKNGLREPLTLSSDGKLLDGNRRFFAVKFALESMGLTDPNKQDLETVPVFVLYDLATKADEQNVLVEENFSPSLKREWPDFVKAQMIVKASEEEGLNPSQIAEKFNWPKGKIQETLRINEIITDFLIFATASINPEDPAGGGLGLGEQEAEVLAAENYQYFNEAQKSFYNPLKSDIDFKFQFFKWIFEQKFSSFLEVRIAHNAWKHPEAKAVILRSDPTAAKEARTILEYNSRVIRNTDDAARRIDLLVQFLKDMTADEIQSLPDASRENLKQALALVAKMSEVASQK